MKKLYFQSSLPRAGSTLFQNVIGQNPEFYVTPTSGVLELVYGARANYSTSPEFKAQDPKLMKDGFLNFCNKGVLGFYDGITDKPFVLDKSRGWGFHYGFLNSFYPNPKIICMVRDPRDIFTSMENNFRKNQHMDSGFINHSELKNTTIEKRMDMWFQTPPISIAMERLYSIIREGKDKKIHFIKYETFTRQPEKEMRKVYDYFELPYFNHDFNNVEQITTEDDSVYGIFGDHNIREKIEPSQSKAKEILGVKVSNWIKDQYPWFYDYFRYT